ncbi:hypothetical protein GCM10010383_42450 [Streptomyces lomondensis]|uniref:Uncharacterized protein n=1 Tax=Streptomyces lomondensis TaxID=68229 RepID=A0ABQ2XAD4_9ACTN|nr:hypothetical protein GCM10010383_42450 [Streptomyces lomondensis]
MRDQLHQARQRTQRFEVPSPVEGRKSGVMPLGRIADVMPPCRSYKEIPVRLGRSRGSLASPNSHGLSVRPAVPERKKQGLSEFRRSLRRVQRRRRGWNGSRVEQ